MMNKIKMLFNSPWIVALFVVILMYVVIKQFRNIASSVYIANTTAEQRQQTAEQLKAQQEAKQKPKFSWETAGIAFLADGLTGVSDYLRGHNQSVIDFLRNE